MMMIYLVAPQVQDHQVGEESQVRRKNLQTVERQIQLLQLQQLPQLLWDLLQEEEEEVFSDQFLLSELLLLLFSLSIVLASFVQIGHKQPQTSPGGVFAS